MNKKLKVSESVDKLKFLAGIKNEFLTEQEQEQSNFTNPTELERFDTYQPLEIVDVQIASRKKLEELFALYNFETSQTEMDAKIKEVVRQTLNSVSDMEDELVLKPDSDVRDELEDEKELVRSIRNNNSIEDVIFKLLEKYYTKHNRRARVLKQAVIDRKARRINSAARKIKRASRISERMLTLVAQIKLLLDTEQIVSQEAQEDNKIKPTTGDTVGAAVATTDTTSATDTTNQSQDSNTGFSIEGKKNINVRTGNLIKDYGSKITGEKGTLHKIYKVFSENKENTNKVRLEGNRYIVMINDTEYASIPVETGSFGDSYAKARRINAIVYDWENPAAQWELYSTLGRDEAITGGVLSTQDVGTPATNSTNTNNTAENEVEAPASSNQTNPVPQPAQTYDVSGLVNKLVAHRMDSSFVNTDEEAVAADFKAFFDSLNGVSDDQKAAVVDNLYKQYKQRTGESLVRSLFRTFDADEDTLNEKVKEMTSYYSLITPREVDRIIQRVDSQPLTEQLDMLTGGLAGGGEDSSSSGIMSVVPSITGWSLLDGLLTFKFANGAYKRIKLQRAIANESSILAAEMPGASIVVDEANGYAIIRGRQAGNITREVALDRAGKKVAMEKVLQKSPLLRRVLMAPLRIPARIVTAPLRLADRAGARSVRITNDVIKLMRGNAAARNIPRAGAVNMISKLFNIPAAAVTAPEPVLAATGAATPSRSEQIRAARSARASAQLRGTGGRFATPTPVAASEGGAQSVGAAVSENPSIASKMKNMFSKGLGFKLVGRGLTRFIPVIGWALLLYDIYEGIRYWQDDTTIMEPIFQMSILSGSPAAISEWKEYGVDATSLVIAAKQMQDAMAKVSETVEA